MSRPSVRCVSHRPWAGRCLIDSAKVLPAICGRFLRGLAGVGMAVVCSAALSAAPAEPWLVINEDNSHFFGSRSADGMTLEGLNAFVDQYAGTKVTHLFLNPNAMRASYASDVRDRIWDVGDQRVPDEDFAQRWVENARLLFERNLDPYAVWIARCREKGISPWITVRMNDVHNVDDPTNFMHSRFWVEHPEMRRRPFATSGSWVDMAFDYGHAEVREHAMTLVRELAARYDMDGIELDWMRFGYHFAPLEKQPGLRILTQFMRDVRALTNETGRKRGRTIRLGARVPVSPEAARGLGMDGVAWAREGVVDVLVPTPFWATADFDIPLEAWRRELGPATQSVRVLAGMELLLRAHPQGPAIEADLSAVHGFASAAWARGADGIYLFNYMDPAPMAGGRDDYRALLERGLTADVVNNTARRFVVTYHDTVPPGVPNGIRLPATGMSSAEFPIRTGPIEPESTVRLFAALAANEGVEQARFDCWSNGHPCPLLERDGSPPRMPPAARVLAFSCPTTSLVNGCNVVQLMQHPGAPEQQIVWVELRVDP